MGVPVSYTKETTGLKPKTDERSSAWVRFHNGKEFLLPIVLRRQKLVPVFHDDGSVGMDVQSPDSDLAPLIDAFFNVVSTVEGSVITLSAESYSRFIGLVRQLLLKNYDMGNDDMVPLLTLSNDQLKFLFENVLAHLRRM